jgi:hypothetical protein
MIKVLVIITGIIFLIVRFILRPNFPLDKFNDFGFIGSFPSFGLIFGFSLFNYSFLNKKNNILFMCSGYTFGGLLYEIVGQKYFHFGTFTYSDVIYTLIGGLSAYLVLRFYSESKF